MSSHICHLIFTCKAYNNSIEKCSYTVIKLLIIMYSTQIQDHKAVRENVNFTCRIKRYSLFQAFGQCPLPNPHAYYSLATLRASRAFSRRCSTIRTPGTGYKRQGVNCKIQLNSRYTPLKAKQTVSYSLSMILSQVQNLKYNPNLIFRNREKQTT